MRRLVFALLGPLALLALAELGYRGWLAVRGTPYSHRAAAAEVRAQLESCRLPVGPDRLGGSAPADDSIPHPYFGWQAPAALEQYGRLASYFERPESEATFDVVVLGGRVARSVAERGAAHLESALSEDARFAGRALRTIYLGHPAFKQPQQLNALTYVLALGWKPDLVVNVDGHNELALGNANDALSIHPLQPAADHWAHLDLSEGSTGEGLDRVLDAYAIRRGMLAELDRLEPGKSWTARVALLSARVPARVARDAERFRRHLAAYEELLEPGPPLGVRGPAQPLGLERRLELIAAQWERSARMLQAICAAHSIEFLQVLAPSGPDLGDASRAASASGSPPASPPGSAPSSGPEPAERVAQAGRTAVQRGYPLLRERARALAADRVPVADASRLFEGAEGRVFLGPDALTEEGLRRLCGWLAAAFLEGRAP